MYVGPTGIKEETLCMITNTLTLILWYLTSVLPSSNTCTQSLFHQSLSIVTTWQLDSDCVDIVVNCHQHGDYTVD